MRFCVGVPPPVPRVPLPVEVRPEIMDALLLPPVVLLLLDVPARDGVSMMGKLEVFGYARR